MSPVLTPPVKAACLACRASKTRCDGQNPCTSCSKRDRQCTYRPSRRGGPRRGIRYLSQRKISTESNDSESNSQSPAFVSDAETSLDAIFGLISPSHGIRNLDTLPDEVIPTENTASFWDGNSSDNQTAHDAGHHGLEFPLIRAYESEEDIVNAYYIFIHPYLPLLPPPAAPQYEDQPRTIKMTHQESFQVQTSLLAHWPTSPLTLALSAILVLIPLPHDLNWASEAAMRWRRSYAEMYMSSALGSIESSIDSLDSMPMGSSTGMGSARGIRISVHSSVPVTFEPVLALVVASIYEYCQRGNVTKMRTRANHAVTLAMDLSLHKTGSQPSGFADAQRRAWWATMFVVYISSCVHGSAPVISINDPRITTSYPQFGFSLEPWPLIFKAQEALFATCSLAKLLSSDVKKDASLHKLSDRIRELDAAIKKLIVESDHSLRFSCKQGAEASAAQNMWLIARLLIHASRLRLHRSRAFMDIPIFLDNHCDIPSINVDSLSNPELIHPSSQMAGLESIFPFTEQESSLICLKSSLATARIFQNLPSPALCSLPAELPITKTPTSSPASAAAAFTPPPLPYFACNAMQCCYALFMLLYKVRAAIESDRLCTCYHLLSQPEPGTEVQDSERLVEELRNGVVSLMVCLKPDVIFEGMSGVLREIENAWHAAFPDFG